MTLVELAQAITDGKITQADDVIEGWLDISPEDALYNFVRVGTSAIRIKPEPREYWLVGGAAGFTFLSLKDAQIERAKGRYEEIIHVKEVL
jgi:hypothetical protein